MQEPESPSPPKRSRRQLPKPSTRDILEMGQTKAPGYLPISQNLLYDIFEAAPDAVLVANDTGPIVYVNRQTEVLFGYARDELLGADINMLLPERYRQVHTMHRQHYFAAPRTRPMGSGLELAGRRKDGSEFAVEISLSPLETEEGTFVISSIRDVTEQRRMQQALLHAEHEATARACEAEARLTLLQLIIDEMPSGVYLVVGPEARLLLANRMAYTVWGAIWQTGQAMHDFLAANQIRITMMNGGPMPLTELATIRAIRQHVSIRQQQEIIRRPDGTQLPVLVNAVTLDAPLLAKMGEADTTGALIVLQDVAALVEAEHLKDEFIAIAAHELRSPLTSLKGFSDMLFVQTARGHGPALADWQNEAIAIINQATDRLVEMTDDLLDVTRLQAGRLELHFRQVDLVTLIQRVINRGTIKEEKKRITLVATPTCIPVTIDVLRIEQVINNLLNNAIKYSPDGGPITITLKEDAFVVLFTIRDEGIGIPAAQQSLLFNRFARADNAHAYGIRGTGLGLYLCRELIERHHGRIWFESAEGAGSTFSFTLPLQQVEAGEDELHQHP